MYFKYEYTIRDLILHQEHPLSFKVIMGARNISVRIRRPNMREQKIGHKPRNAFCTLSVETKISKKNEVIFKKIEENKMLKTADLPRQHQKYKDTDGNEILLPHIKEFPEHFTSFLNQLTRELYSGADLVVGALRWRKNVLGPHQPFSSRGGKWSRDNKYWHPIPTGLGISLGDIFSITRFSKEEKKDIRKIVKERKEEPVYHEMYREAWGQRHSNPRSSLVTGLSALEVATKITISSLVPKSEWLIENLPSPPVVKILRDFIPSLEALNMINGAVLSPPDDILETLKKAVSKRNQIIHLGGQALKGDKLDVMLNAIKDTIWLLDYYLGYEWAYQFISEETRRELEK
jgi:hypothetical protein